MDDYKNWQQFLTLFFLDFLPCRIGTLSVTGDLPLAKIAIAPLSIASKIKSCIHRSFPQK